MIHLSQQTEALAQQLATAQGLSFEQAIMRALEQSARAAGLAFQPRKHGDNSPTAVAVRKSRIDQVVNDIAKMPVLDPRSPREIIDDLNTL